MVTARPANTRTAMEQARRWSRDNLFSSRFNSLLTIVAGLLVAFVVYSVGRFVLFSADWQVVEDNRRTLFIGRYPEEEEWRIWAVLFLFSANVGLAYGLWARITVRDLFFILPILALVFGFLATGTNGLILAAVLAVAGGTYALAHYLLPGTRAEQPARRVAIAAAVATIPFALLLFVGFGGPGTGAWGGLMQNIIIASIAIAASIPVGVLLALGRQSSYRTVKFACVAFIEVVRAGPLVAWLFISRFVLPEFLPPIFGLDESSIIIRATLMMTIFTSAYVAEIVRGGLQSLPFGQVEAANAIGLGSVATTWYIVLPQALRAVIPALVSQLISLWKDTSLISIIGLFDFLRFAQSTQSQPQFVGTSQEIFLFAAFIFWLVAFTMSRLSQRLERSLGIGTR